jgi:hypothetical protein
LEASSSYEESSSSLEEDYTLVILSFALRFFFSAFSFSSFFMRSSKVGDLEVLELEPSSMTIGLPFSQIVVEGLHLHPQRLSSYLQAINLFFEKLGSDTN